jgi:hypothetical protein
MKRSVSIKVLEVDVRIRAFGNDLKLAQVVLSSSNVKRGKAGNVLGIQFGVEFEQNLENFWSSGFDGHVQRSQTLIFRSIIYVCYNATDLLIFIEHVVHGLSIFFLDGLSKSLIR